MSIRTILCLFGQEADTPAVRLGLAVARDLQAHVVGMYVEPEERRAAPGTYIPAVDAASAGYSRAMSAAAHGHYAEAARRSDQMATNAEAHFGQLCGEFGVALLGNGQSRRPPEVGAGLPSASYERHRGALAQVIGQHAHAYDMVVAESGSVARQPRSARAVIDTALMQSGRPVMLAPTRLPEHVGGRIMVAWKDSTPCWHALSQALPFLERAEEVVLFHAGNGHDEARRADDAIDYLAWHGVHATVAQHEPGPAGVADYLMSQASERGVDLLVMGAYSHSPLRERLLGGVTAEVVSHAAATPVLMTH